MRSGLSAGTRPCARSSTRWRTAATQAARIASRTSGTTWSRGLPMTSEVADRHEREVLRPPRDVRADDVDRPVAGRRARRRGRPRRCSPCRTSAGPLRWLPTSLRAVGRGHDQVEVVHDRRPGRVRPGERDPQRSAARLDRQLARVELAGLAGPASPRRTGPTPAPAARRPRPGSRGRSPGRCRRPRPPAP